MLYCSFFNFLIGSIVYRVIYFHKEKITFVSANDSQNYNNIKHPFITLFIAFISGFIAIGQEITWVRTIGYLAGSESSVFGNALGFFLIGSAFGSLSANKIKSHNYIKIIGYIFLISSILFYFSNPFIAFIATYIGNHSLILAFFLVSINSFLIGSIFPLLCKYAIDKTGSSGLKVSRIYFSNILGSVLGPLIITFYLFDKLPIDSLFLYCTLFGLCITIYLFFLTTHKKDFFIHSSLILFFTFFIIFIHKTMYFQFFEKLYYKEQFIHNEPFKETYQNKNGIFNIIGSKHDNDIIINDGIQDGSLGINPFLNVENLPCYTVPAISNKLNKVLIMGNTILPCALILSNSQLITKIDVLENNTNYFNILRNYPNIYRVFDHNKINTHLQMPTQWLQKNNKQYDFIYLNAPHPYKNQSNAFFSLSFFKLIKSSLSTTGIFYINTRGCSDIAYTGSFVFKHIINYGNWVAFSNSPFNDHLNKNLYFNYNNLNMTEEEYNLLSNNIENTFIRDKQKDWQKRNDLFVITDNDMTTEFKIKNKFRVQEKAWVSMLLNR